MWIISISNHLSLSRSLLKCCLCFRVMSVGQLSIATKNENYGFQDAELFIVFMDPELFAFSALECRCKIFFLWRETKYL